MPKKRLAWSCWNYLTKSVVDSEGRRKANVDQVALYESHRHAPISIIFDPGILGHVNTIVTLCSPHLPFLTDGMNDLQHISEKKYGPVLVTLNPPFEPQADKIVGRFRYDHPVLDAQV
jgi:predicted NAD/FAD-binding protein